MSDYYFIEDANQFAHSFNDSEALYQWLLDLHEEIEIEDLTELLRLFVDYELYELYITIKRFEANEINK